MARNDLCIDGTCSNQLVDCSDSIPCTDDSCDPFTGICVNDDTFCPKCAGIGESCVNDADCCLNKCKGGGKKGKTCKE